MLSGIARGAAALILLGTVPALAQVLPNFDPITRGLPSAPPKPPTTTAPPPALPGAAPSAGNPAPPVRSPLDMAPTEALFDAINRADIGAARDAISRGADLNGHNILGMTPMELSVDLGRNDISFLLLSLRQGDSGGNRPPPAAAQTAAKPPAARQAKQQQQRHRPPAVQVAAPVQPQTPRLFSGDGGTPIPNAGFLGFDAGRR